MASSRRTLTVLVLAAGMGKRLRSKRIKLLHPVAGRPMILHVLDAARALRPSKLTVVVGHQAEDVRTACADSCDDFVLQADQRGTGHAVLVALPRVREEPLLILNGDLPALRTSTLRALATTHRRSGAAMTIVTTEVGDPSGYGRIVRDAQGRVVRIVEDKDATAAQRKIREINCGVYCADPKLLLSVLRKVRPDNAQGEYYITDAVRALLERGERVRALLHSDPEEVLGVNTRGELARAGRILYARKAEQLLASGVTLLDADRTWVDPRAVIGRDTVLYPDVTIEGPTILGEDCVVRSGSRIADSVLGKRVEVRDHSVIAESRIADGASVGPFAHLRPGSDLGADSRVGNFVEIKKSKLGRGVKASHLSYLGDAEIGEESNIGAGTITCNYDGRAKHPTILGRGVFVGSDTQLVAPVRIGDGAYVGAGSTVTKDVPAGSLALSRAPQVVKEGWVEQREAMRRDGGKKRKRSR